MSKVIPITRKPKQTKKPKLGPQGQACLSILVRCKTCGHKRVMKPAVVLPGHDGNARCIFGSDADLCGKCGSGDLSIESAPGSGGIVPKSMR